MFGRLWLWIKSRLFVSGPVRIGARFHLGVLSYVSCSKALIIGSDVYIGKFCSIQCNGKIGDGVLIANNVGIVGAMDHDMRQIGTLMRRTRWIGNTPELAADPRNAVEIGPDVWIGFGAVILGGSRIGRGAVVAAGAVVTGEVAPYAVVAGNPARQVGQRFDEDQIERHEALVAKASQ